MISVVMATYNGEKYIERQLTTLLEQTRRPDEVIICDDVSTDNTAQLVQDFIKEHSLADKWHFSINEKNLGYRKNFAQALAKATGNYIFLADQDDDWHLDKIAKFDVSEKIAEQEDNLCALANLAQALKLVDAPEVLYLEEYYGTRLAYYKQPNLKTLAKLKRYPEYRTDSKLRGRLWDYALALHLEKLIAKIAS